jgi:gluconate 2-dehydrogenase gamma chain
MSEQPDRRAFLKSLGTVGATGVAAIVAGDAVAGDAVAGNTVAADAVAEPQAARPPAAAAAPSAAAPHTYTCLSPPEAAFVEAAVDRLIPADDLTPSGTDCGVATFIDRQLAGGFGSGDRMYMQGPWQKGSPGQGYQLPMTPAEFVRAAITATNAHCRKTYQKEFDRLPREQQVAVLQQLERGEIALDPLSSQQFFDLLLNLTMQGFFADPVYGGNRDKVAWKMIGFPGAIAIHSQNIKTYRNKKYDVEPTSIVDLS